MPPSIVPTVFTITKSSDNMIIDTHVHIGNMLVFDMPPENVLYSMDKYGIDFSLVSNIECAENDHNGNPVPQDLQKSQNEVLEKTLEFARANSDKIGVMPWLKIRQETPDKKFIKTISDNRDIVYGLKLHPFHSMTAPDDESLESIYRLAAEYSLPVVSHTGGCPEANSLRLYNAAKKHPEVNFVMVHMDLGTDNSQAIELLGKLPNLYGDTTWVPVESTLKAIKKWGSEKILFGSDNPIDGKDTYLHNPKGDRSLYQQYFNEFKAMVSKEDYDNIMYKNAEILFGIKI